MTRLQQAAPVTIQIHNMDITDIVQAIQATKGGLVREASGEEVRYLLAHIQNVASLAAHDCLTSWIKEGQDQRDLVERGG